MQGYNVIMLYSPSGEQVLMCRRKKEPYLGMSNFVGGKIEIGEAGLAAAYRELLEETGIDKTHVELRHVMDFTYYYSNCYVEVYAGRLKEDANVFGDENRLYWSELNHDFFDVREYAGEGNIGHMLLQVDMHRMKILG